MELKAKKLLTKREYHLYSLAWLIILLGWALVMNYLSNKFFLRVDLTSSKAYTLSKATKQALRELKAPVLIRGYFSSNLPAVLKSDLALTKDLLNEYRIYGKGKIKLEAIDPEKNPSLKDDLRNRGVFPVQFQVRGATDLAFTEGYMALEVQYLDQRQVFSNVVDLEDFEYAISSTILKLASEPPISVAFLSGHEEPDAYQELKTLRSVIEKQYQFSVVSTITGEAIPEEINLLLVIAPKRLNEQDKYALDQFLMRGGKIIFLLDGVEVVEEYLVGFPKDDGLDDLLAHYGITRNHDLVMDEVNARVSMRRGIFQIVQNYPLWVKIYVSRYKEAVLIKDHPILAQLDAITLPWASSINFSGSEPLKAIELLKTSPQSWTQVGQFSLDPERLPSPIPAPGMGRESRALAILVQGSFTSFYKDKPAPTTEESESREKNKLEQSPETSILVVGNSRFIKDEYLALGNSNLDFIINAIDWMTLGGKLIGVRSKATVERPIDQELSIAKVLTVRFLGPFLLPIAIIIYGLARFQVRRREKKLWATTWKEIGK